VENVATDRETGNLIQSARELRARRCWSTETNKAIGMDENKAAATSGGRIVKRARLELETRTGKKVVTSENYLPPRGVKRTSGEGR
jgi:hypothetical protein